MKNLCLILGLCCFLMPQTFAGSVCKSERSKSFGQMLASLEPKADLDLIDLDIFSHSSIVAGYEYEVESAYTKGLYKRTDKWLITPKLADEEENNIAEGVDVKLSAKLENQTVASFTRFFKDPCEAMRTKPYSPRRIPLKASIALGPKFHTGDYFLFRGSVGVVTTAEILKMLGSSMWGVTLSGSYLMQGFYQVHIVRLDDTHIRLKVVVHRGITLSAALGLGYENEFEVFGVNAVNNQLEKLVNTNPVKVQSDFKQSRVFMIDYILDLTEPEVVTAFEKMLPKAKNFTMLGLVNFLRNQKNLEADSLLDLTPIEDLYKRDFAANNVKRVKRNLKTSSEQTTYGFGVYLGNKVLGFKAQKEFSTALLNIRNDDDTTAKYVLKSWEKNWESRFLSSWHKNLDEDSFRALSLANSEFMDLKPLSLVKHVNQTKKRIGFYDFEEVKAKLKLALPLEIYSKIPWENWPQGRKDNFHNFGYRYELAISPAIILETPQLAAEEVSDLFKRYIRRNHLTVTDYFNLSAISAFTNQDLFDMELRKMSKLLENALNPVLNMKERLAIISNLRSNEIFSKSGMGFLIGLNPQRMKQLCHLDLDISSNEALIEYEYGANEMTELYKKILTIKSALDDDSLDLLREAESISMPKAD
jgi:hypothetical protein